MKLILIITLSFLVSACDFVRGVTRSSSFSQYPNTECVLNATRSIDGVSSVRYTTEEGSKPLTMHGIEKPDIIHRYWYTYKDIENDFYFRESFDGSVELRHGYACLNCYPDQDIINTIYPFLTTVEEKLKSQCGVSIEPSNTYESCSGVVCPNA